MVQVESSSLIGAKRAPLFIGVRGKRGREDELTAG
jgi:hypothetical protein